MRAPKAGARKCRSHWLGDHKRNRSLILTSVKVSPAISAVHFLGYEDQWREIPCVIIACMLLLLARPKLGRRLLQLVFMAHPRAALPQRKSRVSRYVFWPEPNSHSNMT